MTPKVGEIVTLASGSQWFVEWCSTRSDIVALVDPEDPEHKIHVLAEDLKPALPGREAPKK